MRIVSDTGTRLWRNQRSRRLLVQAVFLLFVALLLWYVVLRALDLGLSFGFLDSRVGFRLNQQWLTSVDAGDRRLDAYVAAAWNTVRLVSVGLVLTTILGVVVGVARLSSNWLVSRLALAYVEIFRNTPLLIQVIFWFTAVFLTLPQIGNAASLGGLVYVTNRGLFLPSAEGGGLAWVFGLLVVVAAVAALAVRRLRIRHENRTGQPGRGNSYALATFLGLALIAFLATGLPLTPTLPEYVNPERGAARFEDGLRVTPEFAAVLVALVMYTAAFVAEIVRGGIQALPRGQAESATALGLNGYDRMTLIILPQALRTIIPPLTNQYLNLTKNSSLAVAIAYSDLLSVGRQIINSAGFEVPVFLMIMGTYLLMSLAIAAGMNLLNRRVQLVGN